jgi:hypothetical protein
MNGRNWLKLSIWLFCNLVLLSGCEKRLWPSEQGFPAREIVFEIPYETENDIFGFINPDGSGLITRSVAPGLYATLPTWSLDGRFLTFRAEGLGSYNYFAAMRPRVISSEGKTVGWCHDWGRGTGRIRMTLKSQLVFPLRFGEEPNQIVLADFRSCKILSTLFEASGTESSEHLDSAVFSNQGWLAVSRVFVEDRIKVAADIVVIAPDSQKEQVVGHGLAPAWSRDGEWLAYTKMDGIYIVHKDGTQTRKVVDVDARSESYPGTSQGDWYVGLPAPSWSPDGKWLVYHRMTAAGPVICKVNVESGVETEVFQGGMYPDWRWDLDSAGE